MSAFLANAWARVSGVIFIALAAIVALGAAFLKGRKSGATAARNEAEVIQAQRDDAAKQSSIDKMKGRLDANDKVTRMSDADVDNRLRDFYRD